MMMAITASVNGYAERACGDELTAEVIDFPEPDTPLLFRKEGLGYVYDSPCGVTFAVDWLKRRGDELHGTLTVTTRMPGSPPHLHEASQNFTSLTSRNTLARALNELYPQEWWRSEIENFCVSVSRSEREGQPFIEVGQRERRPPVPDQIERILAANRLTWLFGEEGSCKGNVAIALMVCVATGTPFCGLDVRPAVAAYLDWEDEDEIFEDRVWAISKGLGIEPPVIHYRQCTGPLKSQVNEIAREFSRRQVEVYVIDSAVLAGGTNGDHAGAEDSALGLVEALKMLGGTALIIDHLNKTDASSNGGKVKPYGSIFKQAWARTSWLVKKDQEESEPIAHVGLFWNKGNHSGKQLPIGLRLEWAEDKLLFKREDVRESIQLSTGLSVKARMQHLLKTGGRTQQEISDFLDLPVQTIRVELARNKATFLKVPGTEFYGLLEQMGGYQSA